MSTIQDIPQVPDDKWMRNLREKLITIVSGDEQDKQSAYGDVGYCYQCYAPASLYKYYSNTLQNLETVKANRMWYSAPCGFNDVFDCDIIIDNNQLFESILQLCPSAQGMRVGSPLWKELKAQAKKSAKALQDTFTQMRSTMGIACFSELEDSLLMWAHYANNHRGMCVEYELLEINKQLKFTPVPIIYSEERVCFNSLNSSAVEKDTTKIFIESLTSKSPEWSYEKEWRIIRDDSACGNRWNAEKKGALLDMIQPSSIILGCMADIEFGRAIQAYCEENRINLYRMERDTKLYRLIKIPVLQFDD